MYYQKESKSINNDYYNTYTGYVDKETDTNDMLTTIIKILAIIFLLTLIIFGYIFVSNQYYLSKSSEYTKRTQKASTKKNVESVNTIESVASVINGDKKKLSSEDVSKIVQMVMLKMTNLKDKEYKIQKTATKNKIIVSSKNYNNAKDITVKHRDKTEIISSELITEPQNVKFIVVKEGDTLSTIAGRIYGNENDYKKIRDANRRIIKDTNKIFAGQRLRIPI